MIPVDVCPICEAPGCEINEATGVSKCASCGHERYLDCASMPTTDIAPETNKFEYKVMKIKSLLAEKTLNRFGEKGWKLVTIVPIKNNYIYYFVRESFQTIFLNDEEVFELDE